MTQENKDFTTIVPQNISTELSETMTLADIFVKSGYFIDTKSQAQGIVKILAGRELGLSPVQAMENLYIVNGKVGMSAQLMSNMIKTSGKYDYHIDILDNEKCVITFYQINGEKREIGKSSFIKEDAIKCGLINKTSFQNFPRNMLFARALSNGYRWYCPDAIKIGVYTQEELDYTTSKEEIKKRGRPPKEKEIIEEDIFISCVNCKKPVSTKYIFHYNNKNLCGNCYDLERKEK